jgi:hypothetical protein
LQAHIEEQNAYIERLKAEAEFSERENETLKRRNTELEATIGFDVGWNQRRMLKNAIETAEEAIKNKEDSGERHRLVKLSGTYIVDLVLTARHAELSTERFDLAYRPEPEGQLKDREESFVPQPGTETTQVQQQAGV